MLLFNGRWPNPDSSTCAVSRWRSYLFVVAIVASFAISLTVKAQSTQELTLVDAETLALADEPGRAALLARADALEEQSVAAGQLPDPKLRLGLANYPIESGGFRTEGMTQGQIGFRQAFPPGNTRAISTQRYLSMATEMKQNAESRDRNVLNAVRRSWLETYYWSRARHIVDESRPFFTDLVTVTRSLYSVGRKDQHDVLQAELELSRLDDRLIDIDRRHGIATAALSEWLGSEASRPLAKVLPAWESIPSLESLQADLASHPDITAANARVLTQRSAVALAKERFKPGWALDVGYGYRDGSLPNGNSRSDFISLSVTVDLPLFRKNRQSRSLASSLSEQRAADSSRHELLRGLTAQLNAEYARWHDLTRRMTLYENVILEQSTDRTQAALSAYQSDAGDFADVMRGHIDDLNIRLDYLRLNIERAQSYAVIANLGGLPR